MPDTPHPIDLHALTDTCVKCGLCLPHCPTYRVHGMEAESPRGRIAIIDGLTRGQLAPTATLDARLDHCLTCRRCEVVCPAGVQYGRIIDAGRQHLRSKRRLPLARRLTVTAFRRPMIRRLLRGLVALARALRLPALVYRLPGAGRLPLMRSIGLVAPLARPVKTASDGRQPDASGDAIWLFGSCAGDVFDRQTSDAAEQVLARCGYRPQRVTPATCCGALAWHEGAPAPARADINALLAAVPGDAPITATATGCSLMLREADQITGQGADIAQRAVDLCDAVAARVDRLVLRPRPQRCAVHRPCTQCNGLRQPDVTHRLLAAIPQLEVVDLHTPGDCCGAGGSQFLHATDQARATARPMIDRLIDSGATLLVTANIGCALHLADQARQRGVAVEVLHPVALLARQLRNA